MPQPKKPANKTSTTKKNRPTKINWSKVKTEFLADSTLTFKALALKYGVTESAVQKWAKKQDWVNLRDRLAEEATAKLAADLIEQKKTANSRHLAIFTRIQKITMAALERIADGEPLVDKGGAAITDSKGNAIMVPPSAFDLQKYTAALKDAINGERVVLGLPTSVSAHTDPEGRPLTPVFIYDLRGDNANQPEATKASGRS